MLYIEVVLLAIGLSMDSLAVSATSGAVLRNRCTAGSVVKIASTLGLFQAGMTVIGYTMGLGFERYIRAFDHWVAFALLAYLGGKMIYESTREKEEESRFDPLRFRTLCGLGIATSIDALAVGISLAILKSPLLWQAIIIGVVTFLMSASGVYFGNRFGRKINLKLDLIGGLILIGIGVKILVEHLCPLSADAGPKRYFEDSGSIFHTTYHVKYQAREARTEQIDSVLRLFDLSLNPFNPRSTIARVNRGEVVEVDDWFAEVFRKAEEVSRISDGAFDITCAPLINLWGFGFSQADSLTPQAIDSVRAFVGYQKVRLDGRRVVKDDPRLSLNCSAIAKGYACDVVARLLESEGIENYMVEIGGEVTLRGVNPDGDYWRVGINKPETDNGVAGDVEEVVQLRGKGGIATSGDYRNYYVKDGKRYAHTIDPATGYPAGQNILSATIVAPDCMTADAYATTFMVLGLERARALARSLPGIEYFVIYLDERDQRKVAYSRGMIRYLPNRQELAILENP